MGPGKFDFVVFDLETTGLCPEQDEIVEIAAIGVKNGLPAQEFQRFVKPLHGLSAAAMDVNHITEEMLYDAPGFAKVFFDFQSFLGMDAVLVGHNIIGFDLPFLANSAARYHLPGLHFADTEDTLLAAKALWPELSSYSLDSFRQRLAIERLDSHRALADCYDAFALYNAQSSAVLDL